MVSWLLVFATGVMFTKHPSNQTVSQGNAARLGCAVQGVTEPDIVWMKDGEKLYSTDQMFITLGEQHWETYHRFVHTVPECISQNIDHWTCWSDRCQSPKSCMWKSECLLITDVCLRLVWDVDLTSSAALTRLCVF